MADRNSDMKKAAIPILITVGTITLIPGVWALLHLTGAVASQREGADAMAYAMLICWPLALGLWAAAYYCVVQTKSPRRRDDPTDAELDE